VSGGAREAERHACEEKKREKLKQRKQPKNKGNADRIGSIRKSVESDPLHRQGSTSYTHVGGALAWWARLKQKMHAQEECSPNTTDAWFYKDTRSDKGSSGGKHSDMLSKRAREPGAAERRATHRDCWGVCRKRGKNTEKIANYSLVLFNRFSQSLKSVLLRSQGPKVAKHEWRSDHRDFLRCARRLAQHSRSK
jgi:hypothetical protein